VASSSSRQSNDCRSKVYHSLDLPTAPNLAVVEEGHLKAPHSRVAQTDLALVQWMVQDSQQELHILLVGHKANIEDRLCLLEVGHNRLGQVLLDNLEEHHNLEEDRRNLEEHHILEGRHILSEVRHILEEVRHILVVRHIQEVVRRILVVHRNLEVLHNQAVVIHNLEVLHNLEVRHNLVVLHSQGVPLLVQLLVVARSACRFYHRPHALLVLHDPHHAEKFHYPP